MEKAYFFAPQTLSGVKGLRGEKVCPGAWAERERKCSKGTQFVGLDNGVHFTYRDEIVIYRILTAKVRAARRYLTKFKEQIKKRLEQEEMLIVERDVRTL